MIRALWRPCAGISLALACNAAFADTAASADMLDLQIRLFDLNPNDGIAPSVTFNTYYGGLVETLAEAYHPPEIVSDYRYLGAAFANGYSDSVLGTAARATASISGDAYNGLATVHSSTYNTPANVSDTYSLASLSDAVNYALFSLSADTAMVISATGVITTTATQVDQNEGSTASLFLSLSGQDRAQWSQASLRACSSANLAVVGCPASDSRQAQLSVSFVNATLGVLPGIFNGYAESAGYSQTTVVPEPGPASLLFAGLLGLGLFARRRSTR